MLDAFGYVQLALAVVLFAVKVFALIDCLRRPQVDFEIAGSLQKNAWLIILALAVVAQFVFFSGSPLGLLNLAGTVAALVYLAQLRSVRR
ncbi:DUF2516 family protein [Aeromicrobium sp. YIM 150415]|uniref:DUF2516 family protein n=1 Tax=Aeromicrobium piscarium TaxID=2590901 RepID=A0A554S835_9ACTN|nr:MULTISPECIES: DUF2516 family protein [Aeromicrobium]MBM9465273.1 DUF2516 family protein [Aeromicrobium sp. YIM 150415]TSD62519.1 DUF2516 family protein [Aeromicrobium piscarium]